jgi:tetratricopeptide (TPR) repeat protein
MVRPSVLFLFLALTSAVFAQEPVANDARVADAVALIDDSRYDEAMAMLAAAGEPDEARARAKEYVRTNPAQASGHLLVAKVFEAQEFLVPALFSYLRFLALEPASARSAEVAARVQHLLTSAALQPVEGKVVASKSRKEEGDFTRVEFSLWFLTHRLATGFMLDTSGATEFDKAVYVLAELILMETMHQRSKEGKAEVPNFTSTVQRPFFTTLDKRSLVPAYAGLALSTLKLNGTDAWMAKNAKAVERYRTWMQSQSAKPAK